MGYIQSYSTGVLSGNAFFETGVQPDLVMEKIKHLQLDYPLIGKPDIGMKGMAVKKLHTEKELIEYAINSKVNFLIQEFIPFDNEIGLFYYRFPGEKTGHISGIVGKEFLAVTGDGFSTVKELLKQDKRYILQLPVLIKTYGEKLNLVLEEGENFLLVPYGNHVRGQSLLILVTWLMSN